MSAAIHEEEIGGDPVFLPSAICDGVWNSTMRSRCDQVGRQAGAEVTIGVGVWGLPETSKCDKLREFMTSDKVQEKLLRNTVHTSAAEILSFRLHTVAGYDKTASIGTGLFIFKGMHSFEYLDRIASSMSGVRLDKKHTVGAVVTDVCSGCWCPTGHIGVPVLFSSSVKKTSMVDTSYCDECKPSPVSCCCCDEPILGSETDTFLRSLKYVACNRCRKDRNSQKRWRNFSIAGMKVTDTEGPPLELHLSDEAIAVEKDIRGGVPPEPIESDTPFMMCSNIEDILDPTSQHYWPWQMSSLEYLEYIENQRFNNPMQETPQGDWAAIEVTEQILLSYQRQLPSVCEKYGFLSPEEPGDAPKEVVIDNTQYRLVDNSHGMTCDSPLCQAVFQHQDSVGNFAWAALIAPIIPMYTTRKGLIGGTAREIGYGVEKCLVCLDQETLIESLD